MCVYACTWLHRYARNQRTTSGVAPQEPLTLFLETVSYWGCSLSSQSRKAESSVSVPTELVNTASRLPPRLDLHVGASTWTLSLCFCSQHFTYWATSQSPYSLLWIYSIFLFPSTTYLYLQHVSGNYPNKHKNEISSIILWCDKSKTYLFIVLWKLVSKWNNSSYSRAARVLK